MVRRLSLSFVLLCIFALVPVARAETIHVSAAVSLRDVLTTLADAYHADTGDDIVLTFGSSGQLLAQIKSGAEADVFISAAESQVRDLETSGFADTAARKIIARNSLVLIVPAQAAAAPDSFAALVTIGGRIAVGEPRTVPAGTYALQTLAALNLADALKDRIVYGGNVRQVLAYVETGDAAAGMVYLTDALELAGKVRIVATADPSTHAPIVYPAVILSASKKRTSAARFLAYLASPSAAREFAAKGFAPVSASSASSAPAAAPAAPPPHANSAFLRSVLLSLEIAIAATLAVAAVGLPIAYLLARKRFPGRLLLEALLMLPLVLPPTVVGYTILKFFGRAGWLGGPLNRAIDYSPLFRFEGAVLAAAVVAFPLLYMPAKAAFQTVDKELEDIARIFGATRWQRFWHVSLPLARRGIASGLILAFARALGEFGATLMVYGWQPGKVTLPISVYAAYEQDRLADAALPVVVLSFLSLLLILAYNRSAPRGE